MTFFDTFTSILLRDLFKMLDDVHLVTLAKVSPRLAKRIMLRRAHRYLPPPVNQIITHLIITPDVKFTSLPPNVKFIDGDASLHMYNLLHDELCEAPNVRLNVVQGDVLETNGTQGVHVRFTDLSNNAQILTCGTGNCNCRETVAAITRPHASLIIWCRNAGGHWTINAAIRHLRIQVRNPTSQPITVSGPVDKLTISTNYHLTVGALPAVRSLTLIALENVNILVTELIIVDRLSLQARITGNLTTRRALHYDASGWSLAKRYLSVNKVQKISTLAHCYLPFGAAELTLRLGTVYNLPKIVPPQHLKLIGRQTRRTLSDMTCLPHVNHLTLKDFKNLPIVSAEHVSFINTPLPATVQASWVRIVTKNEIDLSPVQHIPRLSLHYTDLPKPLDLDLDGYNLQSLSLWANRDVMIFGLPEKSLQEIRFSK